MNVYLFLSEFNSNSTKYCIITWVQWMANHTSWHFSEIILRNNNILEYLIIFCYNSFQNWLSSPINRKIWYIYTIISIQCKKLMQFTTLFLQIRSWIVDFVNWLTCEIKNKLLILLICIHLAWNIVIENRGEQWTWPFEIEMYVNMG